MEVRRALQIAREHQDHITILPDLFFGCQHPTHVESAMSTKMAIEQITTHHADMDAEFTHECGQPWVLYRRRMVIEEVER